MNHKHGLRNTRFYRIWKGVKQRCTKEYSTSYKDYGAKGVTISDEWLDFQNFMNDMHEGYKEHVVIHGEKETTIDRIDSTKGYSKDNCRWATTSQQNENRKGAGIKFKAISPDGIEYIDRNYSKFAKEHGLAKGSIKSCLDGNSKQTKGWKFELVEGD